MQAERMKAQAETRARLWQHGLKTGSPVVIAAAASLWGIHTVGNNTKTAIMAALVLFKVLLPFFLLFWFLDSFWFCFWL